MASPAVRDPSEAHMTVSAATRRFVRERAQRRCEYCHADERWQICSLHH